MREIKFRAWHKADKKMYRVVGLYLGRYEQAVSLMEEGAFVPSTCPLVDVELMEFTGLKDRHGNEVYDGYILKTEGDRILQVVWYEHGFNWDAICINCTPPEKPCASSELRYLQQARFEIIGNIYENGELRETAE